MVTLRTLRVLVILILVLVLVLVRITLVVRSRFGGRNRSTFGHRMGLQLT